MSVVLLVAMTSCGSTTYLITSSSENLRSLTKITEEGNSCYSPSGGFDSNAIFFTVAGSSENGYEPYIYKKDNPLAPAKVEIACGHSSTYCSKTDRVAFSRVVNGHSDIYMMSAGKNKALIPVTETAGVGEYSPSFSKDGKLLAYQKELPNTKNDEIWLKNLSTGETMLLGSGVTPSISPDGNKIAFSKIESSNTSNIWVMDIDGSNAQQLTASKDAFAYCPMWSPSGKKIVFQSNKKKSNFDIFVMNANGTGLVQLTNNDSDDVEPFWSTDEYIYMSSDRGAKKGNFNIWRFSYDD